MWALGLIMLEIGLRRPILVLFPPLGDANADSNAPAMRRVELDRHLAACPAPWRAVAEGLLQEDLDRRWSADRAGTELAAMIRAREPASGSG
jgi:hypothetical protein